MAILGGVVATDDEMRNVWCEIVFVDATELGNLLSNVCLFEEESRSVSTCDDVY